MKIIDILIDSATLLGLNDEIEFMKTLTEENEFEEIYKNRNVDNLFNLFKYSVKELCTNYAPMISSLKFQTSNSRYPIVNLENFIKTKYILKEGSPVKFKILNREFVFEEDGVYEIYYEAYPTINSMFEDVDFLENLSPDAMVLGLCAYFALSHGRFDEFEEFHDKYLAKAESLKELQIFNLPSRRWE